MPRKTGPTPKPADERQATHKDRGKIIPFSAHAITPPDPPKEWLASTRTLWDEFWASDMAKALRPGQTDTLVRLLTYRDEWHRCMAAFRKERLAESSQGVKLSPYFDAAMKLEDRIGRLGSDLGMTPYALMRLGVETGRAAKTIEELNALADDPEPEEDPRAALVIASQDD